MIHRERIRPCVLFREEPHRRCVVRSRRGKKFEASSLFSGSVITTSWRGAMAAGAGLTWLRKFSLRHTGNIFQRSTKPLQIHAVYDIVAGGKSFVAGPACETAGTRCNLTTMRGQTAVTWKRCRLVIDNSHLRNTSRNTALSFPVEFPFPQNREFTYSRKLTTRGQHRRAGRFSFHLFATDELKGEILEMSNGLRRG